MPMQRAAETRRGDEDELVVALLSTPIFELVDETACEPIDTFFSSSSCAARLHDECRRSFR